MGVPCEFLVFVQGSRVQVVGNVCVVTKGRTLLVITQVSSGLKKSHILIFSKYKYLYVNIASLANVKSCVTIGKCLALYSLIGLPLRLSPLTKDISMTTVFICGVNRLGTYTFVAFLNIHSFIQFFFTFHLGV